MRAYRMTVDDGSNLRAFAIGEVTVALRRFHDGKRKPGEGERREQAVAIVEPLLDRLGIPYERSWWER